MCLKEQCTDFLVKTLKPFNGNFQGFVTTHISSMFQVSYCIYVNFSALTDRQIGPHYILYNPKSEKVGTVWKMQIKKESSDFINLPWLVFHCRQYEHKIFHVLSGKLHLICKYTSIPVIGRGSPVCQQMREQIIKKNLKQCFSKKDSKGFGYFTLHGA